MRRRHAIAVIASVLLLFAAVTAMASAHAPRQLLVARGVSPAGQPWSQHANMYDGRLFLDLSLPQPDGDDFGAGVSFVIDRRLPLIVGRGEDELGESEVDGYVHRSVVHLIATTPAGPVHIPLVRAPRKLTDAWPAIRAARFFVAFFPLEAAPTVLTAYDARWRPLRVERVGR